MEQILLIVHFFVAVVLIVLVLVQRGKGADVGAAFGSGASQTVFGSKGSIGFLMKFTFAVGALFFVTSVSLTYMAAQDAKSANQSHVLTNVETIAKEVQSQKKSDIKAPVINKEVKK